MKRRVDDLRILASRPLVPPSILIEEIPRSEIHSQRILDFREAIGQIVLGKDERMLVITGPCSIHDPISAIEYAERLLPLAKRFEDELVLVMRAYFEKPRSVGGWKGFIYDPDLNETHNINRGLRGARQFLRDLAEMGIPAATEFLDPTVPQFIADFVSWGAVGARTVESQTHRELASGLSMPIGFKNAIDGRVQPAVDAALVAGTSHWFASNTKDGLASHFQSSGNETCHIILRGGSKTGPNYLPVSVSDACGRLSRAGLVPKVMVDCSHGNSEKDHTKQKVVLKSICEQLESGSRSLMGVMLESHLVAGNQPFGEIGNLTYGQSVTDACIDLTETEILLEQLALAVKSKTGTKR